MLQRFLTQPHSAPREDVEYMIEQLNQFGRNARAAAQPQMMKGAA